MYTLSVAVDVNPPGAEPVLERDDVWRGLVMKAENALPFVPMMQECEVLERSANGLVRRVAVRGERYVERITFTPQIEVRFLREDAAGQPAGWITNVISDSDHGLLLTFSFSVSVANAAPGSAEERLRGEEMRGSYIEAVTATIAATRQFVREGRLAAAADP